MAKKSRDYWSERFKQIEQIEHGQGVKCYADIENLYRKAQRQIESQIEAWYGRFADNNGITLTEAKRLLTTKQLAELKWDVQEYIRYGQANAVSGQWVKQLENASARYHINRLEALHLQMQQSIEALFGNQLDDIDQTMRAIYKDGFYRTAFGKNFSSRIWDNKQKLVNELNTTLTQGVVLGQDPQKTIDTIARKMNTSKKNAGRLVMTEQAFFSETAQHDSFKELGVELYEIVATLDSHTSEICQDMDGKKFKISEWEVGATAPPFHVYCRSTTVPAFDDEFDLIGERAARGEDGKTYYVPSTMTYKEWQKSFVDGDKTGLKEVMPDDKIELEPRLTKLKAAMPPDDFSEYLKILEENPNSDIRRLYSQFGDLPSKITKTANEGAYSPSQKTIKYDMPTQAHMDNGIHKYSTLAHEYGHAFDNLGTFDGLHYSEVDTLNEKVKIGSGAVQVFKRTPSSSDEFLTALRKDKEELRKTFNSVKFDILSTYATAGVQDALEGFFGHDNTRLVWGHGDKYYNRKFNKWIKAFKKEKEFGQALKELGIDASNHAKRMNACRMYETASEAWANIMSAVTCQGEELEEVKKYLPNAYDALLSIIGKVG